MKKQAQVQKDPDVYISYFSDEAGDHWSLIYKAMPLCKSLETFEEVAEVCRLKNYNPDSLPTWNGNSAKFIYSVEAK